MKDTYIVSLYRGMSEEEFIENNTLNFPNISWWSDNPEDAITYKHGYMQKISVVINKELLNEFIYKGNFYDKDYNFGKINSYFTTDWYSFSKKYLEKHLITIEQYEKASTQELIYN